MTKERYRIEELKKEDVETVVNLVRSSFEKKYLIPSIYRGKGIDKFISNEIDNPFSPYKYFVLWDENTIAGYAEYKIFESTSTAFLNIISVSNDYKNKGIGRKIYEYSKNFFIEKGFASIALDVYESNKIALDWYINFGFKQISSNSFYEIKLKDTDQDDSKIFIQNFPQYKELQNSYGFYFLDVVIENENHRLGTIDEDLIVRGNYSSFLEKQLPILSKKFQFKKIYFVGSESQSEGFEFVDKILRMELNIKL